MSTREAWNASWDVNVTGTYVLTEHLVPLLLKSKSALGPRLFFITSGTSPLANTEDLSNRLSTAPPAGWPKTTMGKFVTSYRSSKTGMNMMAREWERMLRNDGVKVFIISPGLLATGLGGDTEMLRKMGAEEPEVGGRFVKDVVEGKRDQDAGKAINRAGIQPW
jgi:NAD(P)-dependent dehydrogenase (short-subunit alcohol dehydrogenase family)